MAFKKTIIGLLLLIVTIASLFYAESAEEYSHKGELELATEYPPPSEAEATENIVKALEEILTDTQPSPKWTTRGAHAKQHGLVKAEFTVLDDLADQYRIGVFEQPQMYNAWVRYSSLSGKDPDFKKGARGLAIKLMGVEGEKILPGEMDAQTQDFVFMSTPFFVSKDVKGFADLLDGLRGGKISSARFFITHPRMFMLVQKSNSNTPDLLGVDWSSATPYLFGDRAVKYAVFPREPSQETMPTGDKPSPDFLRERLVDRLTDQDVILDFYVQFQTDAKKMPIEDPRIKWDPKRSPFIKLATIRIPQQEFDTPAQHLYGDRLSFTPWHSLPEHRPLGGINRGRKTIYDTMSKFRHDRNNENMGEPTNWVDFSE